jgi:hypothetical protein
MGHHRQVMNALQLRLQLGLGFEYLGNKYLVRGIVTEVTIHGLGCELGLGSAWASFGVRAEVPSTSINISIDFKYFKYSNT